MATEMMATHTPESGLDAPEYHLRSDGNDGQRRNIERIPAMSTERNAWDRAAEAERRRCKRMGLICDQPSRDGREETYEAGDVVTLANSRGVIATYRVTTTGMVRRVD
jgi:hypothetical protein